MNLIDFGVLIPFALITTFTPGPNNLSCTSMSINFGIKKTMNYIYGIVTWPIALLEPAFPLRKNLTSISGVFIKVYYSNL
jgi:hypothetical protein